MHYVDQWKALSARIRGLAEAAGMTTASSARKTPAMGNSLQASA